jgi:hypothetical protein
VSILSKGNSKVLPDKEILKPVKAADATILKKKKAAEKVVKESYLS